MTGAVDEHLRLAAWPGAARPAQEAPTSASAPAAGALELWAGPECTVNRVGDRFRDQLGLTGFSDRLDDLDRLADIGITRLRMPLLWERTCPEAPGLRDWRWADPRIERLRELRIQPIVGLLHHGSGPRWTNLLDPRFPEQLADYARLVAERYPHLRAWTPVNEPQTTARFSGLYGLWYPHGSDTRAWLRALLNQLRGTVLAMRAVRGVTPGAELVQTDDLGFTFSTPLLAYQAAYENERRWLGFDLLAGRVDRHHPLWHHLLENGATEAELMAFVDEPCPPDVIGINSYVTSERYLDEQPGRWPGVPVGGNGRHRYVDLEAVRVPEVRVGGFAARLREAHARYGCALAITEVHMGCTREEQMRWLHQAWLAAQAARAEGIDVRAVTAWAAFGTVDWDSLLTREAGHYEAGLWDVRTTPPRPTAVCTLARQLARGETPAHPALAGAGWWERDLRHGAGLQLADPHAADPRTPAILARPILITGATGTLGRALARLCVLRGLNYRLLRRCEMDIADPVSVAAALERHQPWAVVNAAGFVRVDDAEADDRQWRENAVGPEVLARACARHGVALMGFSSDLVFAGEKRSPYVESDEPGPLSAYGRAKLQAERSMLALAPEALVIRTSAFFGPWDAHNFVRHALDTLASGSRFRAASDQVVSPTYVPQMVNAALDLLVDGEAGVWHLANAGEVTWAGLARLAAEFAGLDAGAVQAVPGAELGWRASRPAYSVLHSERGMLMPPLEEGLLRYLADREAPSAVVEPDQPVPQAASDLALAA